MILSYKKYGSAGTPVIILHGLFGSGRNWHAIANYLSNTHIVYTIDLPNHGNSPHTEWMDYPQMIEELQSLLAQLGLTSVNVIGHSMGGKVAMWMALSYPDSLGKLVVVDIAPVNYAHSFEQILHCLEAMPLDKIHSRNDADAFMSQSIIEPGLRQFLLQNLVYNNGSYSWRLNLQVISQSMHLLTDFPDTTRIQPFTKKSLFIAGEQSDYLTAQQHHSVKQLFPTAVISTIKNAGHWPHAEQPALYTKLTEKFLQDD